MFVKLHVMDIPWLRCFIQYQNVSFGIIQNLNSNILIPYVMILHLFNYTIDRSQTIVRYSTLYLFEIQYMKL
jgi:hypothetical protein